MYLHSAALYDLMHQSLDYESAANRVRQLIADRYPGARSLLDVACGTGRHLELLGVDLVVEGLDINAEMLNVARARCPTAVLHQADMRTFDLGRQFDVVTCLFGSIGYVESFDELVTTIRNLGKHVMPGGFIVVEPWLSPERYRLGALTAHSANSEDVTVSWMYSAEIADGRSIFDIHHLVGSSDDVEHFVERHSLALFTTEQYERAFRLAGLTSEFDEVGLFGYGMLIAKIDRMAI